ncbi:MAG TPA: DUF3011 domain-containing protein [Candidatus Udaeobacter sp.]|nr:DUF3011 domain-containing protein [Candidatus Udaeobacter sp.]
MRILKTLVVLCALICPFAKTVMGQSNPSGGRQVPCSSDDGRRRYCPANTRAGVALEKQTSGATCQQGYSWGYDQGGIWVDHGCRAYFRVEYERPGENRGAESIVRCSSDDGGRHYCEADTRGDVDLIRQHSEAPCDEGVSWGFDQRGIWVDHGCRAEFVAQPNERPEHTRGSGGPTQSLYCASDDGRRNYCQVDARGGVQLVKQRSGAACQEGYSWGADEHGIWVDHGCRADFVAAGRGEWHGDEHGHGHGRACNRSIGQERADELERQCKKVAPGNRSACNDENSCRVITDEIRRGCQLLGRDGPQFCEDYR